MRVSKHLPAIHVEHNKNTMNCPTEKMPIPDKVYVSMVQHIGAPCQPKVAVGDLVKVGQVIGDSDAYVSAPIHSGVSGKVTAIETTMTSMGIWDPIVTIVLDKKQEVVEGLAPPVVTDKDSFLKAVRDSGLVGLGGAAFPTHVKFNPKNLDEVDTLIINGAECEPYITSDYRAMLEDTDYIIGGIKNTMKYLGIKRCIIAIEENKAPAIKLLRDLLKDSPEIEVMELRSLYPQGAERVLIYEATGRVMPLGKLPADIGTIVSNITSIITLEKYLQTGMPLVAKRITVDGTAVRTPKNVEVLIGTPINEIIEFCGGYKRVPRKILMGGPMMGRAIYDDGTPLIKNNNAILAFDKEWAEFPKETACINCGRCVKACPLHLMPTSIFKAYDKKDIETLKKLKVPLCMECGCCSYVCPAKKQLSFINRLAKQLVQEGGKK
ncbi:MAG: electron transport complex subunit RsxC [Eubacteriales bacterium]|nr:electron transport complex subunit RsxC [Eubacteriales bacterium]